MNRQIVLVGCGNMGRAMLQGWIAAGKAEPSSIHVVEPDDRLRKGAAQSGAAAYAEAAHLPAGLVPAIVLFAVKPQVMRDIVPAYRRFAEVGTTFVSIAAGTPIALFEKLLGADAAIIRSMPNTPAAIGKGMLVNVANRNVSSDIRLLVRDLFTANGRVAEVDDEALIDAVTAVSGSGPAYIFHFIEALAAAAENAGLSRELAATLARQTVVGSAALAEANSETPETLRRQVTSPNGTTQAGLEVLMKGLTPLLTETVEAARRRSVELRG
jgi:pyrroline-5-carboxylate reductase